MDARAYEARTLLGLGVFRCRTCVVRVRHRHDPDKCNYMKLCNLFKLLVVSACFSVRVVSGFHS